MKIAQKLWIGAWGEEKYFTKYSKILELKSLQKYALRGLLVSSGDLTESLSNKASDCLYNFIEEK